VLARDAIGDIQMLELEARRFPKNFDVFVTAPRRLLLDHTAQSATAIIAKNFTTSAWFLKASRDGLSPAPKFGARWGSRKPCGSGQNPVRRRGEV